MFIFCIPVLVILIPIVIGGIAWKRNPDRIPLGTIGVFLFLCSAFYVNWISLSPLEYLPNEKFLPLLPSFFRLLGLPSFGDTTATALKYWGSFTDIQGWQALLLTGAVAGFPWQQILVTLLIFFIVIFTWVNDLKQQSVFALSILQLFLSVLLLFLICYALPEIDGLGETGSISMRLLFVVFTAAKLIWWGPLIAGAGLLLIGIQGVLLLQKGSGYQNPSNNTVLDSIYY